MPSEELRREAAGLAFENAGREISQAFGILNANLTLAAGTLGVLITVLGAGELFGQDVIVEIDGLVSYASTSDAPTLWGLPRFSDVSVLLLGAAFPLILRFFIRATIGYQQLLRFNLVQRDVWRYLADGTGWDHARLTMELYVQQWLSPKPVWDLLWGSFKYGFAWVFAVSTIVLGWGFISAPGLVPRIVAGVFVIAGLAWDVITLARYKPLRTPTPDQLAELEKARPQAPSTEQRPLVSEPGTD
jgi:hypothetical protein